MPSAHATGAETPLPLQRQLPTNGEDALSQGELDGLCGLYAGVNGLRLLFALERKLKRREVKRLFDTGIAFLHGHGQLHHAATKGFRDKLWRELLSVLVAEAISITGRAVIMTQPLAKIVRPSRTSTFAVIDVAIAAGQPVLIELSGTYNYFTVVNGYSPSRLFLFDSGVLHWLTRKSCTTVKPTQKDRHHINTRSLTTLAFADGSKPCKTTQYIFTIKP